METLHRIHIGDAREMVDVDTDAVDLVVTSPPYPMIELWDETFIELDPAIESTLSAGDGRAAFAAMHDILDRAWAEIARVLRPGGIAVVNVGDATRTIDGRFRVYPNHARVVQAFDVLGLDPLPEILWRKPANSSTKFMGSGMVPTNAYPTLEHEYLLIFRNGGPRTFEPGSARRYASAYFWEERNQWFSDVWVDVTGRDQSLEADARRDRSAAYPVTIPYRLINMFSVYGDTVLDPFLGTGTTTIAAMAAGRQSIGIERDAGLIEAFEDLVSSVPSLSRSLVKDRLARHRTFVASRCDRGEAFEHFCERYEMPVMTAQERSIEFKVVDELDRRDEATYRATHRVFESPTDEDDAIASLRPEHDD